MRCRQHCWTASDGDVGSFCCRMSQCVFCGVLLIHPCRDGGHGYKRMCKEPLNLSGVNAACRTELVFDGEPSSDRLHPTLLDQTRANVGGDPGAAHKWSPGDLAPWNANDGSRGAGEGGFQGGRLHARKTTPNSLHARCLGHICMVPGEMDMQQGKIADSDRNSKEVRKTTPRNNRTKNLTNRTASSWEFHCCRPSTAP